MRGYTVNATPMHCRIKKYRGDYIGKKFGKLTVIAYPSYRGVRMGGALCKCECGNEVFTNCIGNLVRGVKTQCKACGKKQMAQSYRENHPQLRKYPESYASERLYTVWSGMKTRCNRTYGPYADVNVCEEWKDYQKFREWALSTGYDKDAPRGECTIDRINPFGDYEPSNCRWVDMDTQCHNRRKDWLKAHPETVPATT